MNLESLGSRSALTNPNDEINNQLLNLHLYQTKFKLLEKIRQIDFPIHQMFRNNKP